MNERPYYALNEYLQQHFGGKVAKISLDAGFTCPNRDGSKGRGGCAFCSPQGSGEFAGSRELTLQQQFDQVAGMVAKKWPGAAYIAHFQAYTNTYAPVNRLRLLYEEALAIPGVVGLAIATRPDCLPEEVLDLLAELNQQHFLWVELGLQSSHENTARDLNLGYSWDDFVHALTALNRRGIRTVGHIICGLPGESESMMRQTADQVADLPLWGLKIHLFHLLKGSLLEPRHEIEPISFLDRRQYLELVIYTLEHLSEQVVIHRLTGDPPRRLLIEPKWCTDKWTTLNELHRLMAERHTWQGRLYTPRQDQGINIPPSQ